MADAGKKSYRWYYIDDNEDVQGPFPSHAMKKWLAKGAIEGDLKVRYGDKAGDPFLAISQWYPDLATAFDEEPGASGVASVGGVKKPGVGVSSANRGKKGGDSNAMYVVIGGLIAFIALALFGFFLWFFVISGDEETGDSSSSVTPVASTDKQEEKSEIVSSICVNGIDSISGAACGTACVGSWLNDSVCHSGYNVHTQTFTVSTAAAGGGQECEFAHGDTRVPTGENAIGCGDGSVVGDISTLSIFAPIGLTNADNIKNLMEDASTNPILVKELASTWGVDRSQVVVSGVSVSVGSTDYELAAETASTNSSAPAVPASRKLQVDEDEFTLSFAYVVSSLPLNGGAASLSTAMTDASSVTAIGANIQGFMNNHRHILDPAGGVTNALYIGDLSCAGVTAKIQSAFTEGTETSAPLAELKPVDCVFEWISESAFCAPIPEPTTTEAPEAEGETTSTTTTTTTTTSHTTTTTTQGIIWGTYDRTYILITEAQHGGKICEHPNGFRQSGAPCHNCTLAIGDFEPKCELSEDRAEVLGSSKRDRLWSDQVFWGGRAASDGGQCEELGEKALSKQKCPFRCIDGTLTDEELAEDEAIDPYAITHEKMYGADTTCGIPCEPYTDLRCSSGDEQMEGWTGLGWNSDTNYGKNCLEYKALIGDDEALEGWAVPSHNPHECGNSEIEGTIQMEVKFADYKRFTDGSNNIAGVLTDVVLKDVLASALGIEDGQIDQITNTNVRLVNEETSSFDDGHESGVSSTYFGMPGHTAPQARLRQLKNKSSTKKTSFRSKRKLDTVTAIPITRAGGCDLTKWEGGVADDATAWEYHGYKADKGSDRCPCIKNSVWYTDCDDADTSEVYDNFLCWDTATGDEEDCPCLDLSGASPVEIACPAFSVLNSDGTDLDPIVEVPFPLEVVNKGKCSNDGAYPDATLNRVYIESDAGISACPILETDYSASAKASDLKCVDDSGTEVDCPCVKRHAYSTDTFQGFVEADCPCTSDSGTTYEECKYATKHIVTVTNACDTSADTTFTMLDATTLTISKESTSSSGTGTCNCVVTTISKSSNGDSIVEEVSACSADVQCEKSDGTVVNCPPLHTINVVNEDDASKSWSKIVELDELCYTTSAGTKTAIPCPLSVTTPGQCTQTDLTSDNNIKYHVAADSSTSTVDCPSSVTRMTEQTASISLASSTTLVKGYPDQICYSGTDEKICPCLSVTEHFYKDLGVSGTSIIDASVLAVCPCVDETDADATLHSLHSCLLEDATHTVADSSSTTQSADVVRYIHSSGVIGDYNSITHLVYSAVSDVTGTTYTRSTFSSAVNGLSNTPVIACYDDHDEDTLNPQPNNIIACPFCILQVEASDNTVQSLHEFPCPILDGVDSWKYDAATALSSFTETKCKYEFAYFDGTTTVKKITTYTGNDIDLADEYVDCLMMETFESGEIRDYSSPLVALDSTEFSTACSSGTCPCLKKKILLGDIVVGYDTMDCPCFYENADGDKIWAECTKASESSMLMLASNSDKGSCEKGNSEYELLEGSASADAIECPTFETTLDSASQDIIKQEISASRFPVTCWTWPDEADKANSVPVQHLCPCIEDRKWSNGDITSGSYGYNTIECPKYAMTLEWDFEVSKMVNGDGGADRLQDRIKDNAEKEDTYHEEWKLDDTISTAICAKFATDECTEVESKFWTYQVKHCDAVLEPLGECDGGEFTGLYGVTKAPVNGGEKCVAAYVEDANKSDEDHASYDDTYEFEEGTTNAVEEVKCQSCEMEWVADFSECDTYTTTTTTTTSADSEEAEDSDSDSDSDEEEEEVFWTGQYKLQYRIKSDKYAYYELPTGEDGSGTRNIRVECNFWSNAGFGDEVEMYEEVVGDCSATHNADEEDTVLESIRESHPEYPFESD